MELKSNFHADGIPPAVVITGNNRNHKMAKVFVRLENFNLRRINLNGIIPEKTTSNCKISKVSTYGKSL